MGGKPKISTTCVCGHKRAIHKDGCRCLHHVHWESEDRTQVSDTICICHEFRAASTHKITQNEVTPIHEQA